MQVDWGSWLRRWDDQQSLHIDGREERLSVMFSAVEAIVAAPGGAADDELVVLDIGVAARLTMLRRPALQSGKCRHCPSGGA